MSWIVLAVGSLIALLGWAIGRFKLVKLLSTIEPGKLISRPVRSALPDATGKLLYWVALSKP